MAFDIDYFLKINNTYGTTSQKYTQLYILKSQVNDRFSDTIDCYKVKVNDVDKELLIIRTLKQDEKTIKSRPDEDFSIGDYIVFDNKTWLVISKDACNQTYTTGTMKLTNYTIKFQSSTGTILSYPCIDDGSNLSIGVDSNNTISTLNGIKRIKLPFDDNTKLIGIDRRFFLDKVGTTTYKVTNVNNTSFSYGDKGLIELTLQQDEYNPLTDKNGVCNYFEPTVTPPTPDPTIPTEIVTITSDAEDNNIKLGIIYTFSATFKNELGVDVTGVISQYSLNTNYGNLVNLVDNHNGTCTVQVDDDAYELLTSTVVLTCYDAAHGFSASVTLTIVGLF